MATDPLTQIESEILMEIDGRREARPWGAHVGAAMGFLKGSGYVDRQGKLTDKGRVYLEQFHPQDRPSRGGK